MISYRVLLSVALMSMLPVILLAQPQPQHCRDGLVFPGPEPRNSDVICLPELGRMLPSLYCGDRSETFGQQIVPLGDIDGDSLCDWIIGQVRCDTTPSPIDLLLYHGRRGQLPSKESGVRIGPTEILSSSYGLASGDWDNDGNIDLAIRIQVYGDLSDGAHPGDHWSKLAIFWGDSSGSYHINDTTRLSCDAVGWYGWDNAISADVDHDGIADLTLFGSYGYGLKDGAEAPVPRLLLFRGHQGQRWGHDGILRTADWRWWNPPPMTNLGSGDQDADGYRDVYLYYNAPPTVGTVSVLYGRADGNLPDTLTDVETVDLLLANGKTSLFKDVTGDHIPELLVTSGSENKIKVFVGLKGQRLTEQYGPGVAALDTASKHWWKRPWAEVWEPKKIKSNWPGAYDLLYDLGDIDLDGIGDIASYNSPWLTFYRGGHWMDSLIDAMVDTRAVGGRSDDGHPGAVAVLGDIDGSHVPTIAVSKNGILYVKPSRDVPSSGIYRELPDDTGPASVKEPTKVPAIMNLTTTVPR